MKYLTASALALSVLSFNASAEFMLGGNLYTSFSGEGEAEAEASGFGESVTVTEDMDASGLGLFIGYKTEKNNRFKLGFDSIEFDFDESGSEDATGLTFDWDFVYGEDQFKPYWGLGFGFYTLDVDLDAIGSDEDELNGVSVQLAGGVKVALNNNAELDFSFKRQAVVWETVEFTDGFRTVDVETTYVHNSVNVGAAFMF